MSWFKRNKSSLFILALLILVSIPAVIPLFHKGFFITDDGEWMIIRQSAFYFAFRDGQIPVRFLHRLNFGYGYPVVTFLYPGFLYLGVLLHLIKLGFINSIKVILGISLLGSTIFTYFWLSKLFQKSAAYVAAVFSLYIPYHLFDVYTRGSVGEIFALLWVPFIFWMFERKSIFFLSIGIFLLIISHNTLAVLFLPFFLLYALLRNVMPYKQILFCVFFGILLSSFFTIPLLFELRLTQFPQSKVSNPFNYFANIQEIGYSTVFVFFISIIFLFKLKYRVKSDLLNRMFLFFFIISFASIFFSTLLSYPFWQEIPSSFIQFPFRFLSLLIISIAFPVAFIVSNTKRIKKISFIVFLTITLLISLVSTLKAVRYFVKPDDLYMTNDATTTVKNEYMPVWVNEIPTKRPINKAVIIKGRGTIQNLTYNNKEIQLTVDIKKEASIQINTIYWPGWKASLDNNNIPLSYNNPKGVIQLSIPVGLHTIDVSYRETPLGLFADFLSILAFFGLIFYSKMYKRSRNSV